MFLISSFSVTDFSSENRVMQDTSGDIGSGAKWHFSSVQYFLQYPTTCSNRHPSWDIGQKFERMEEQVSSLSADTFRTPWKDKTVQLTGNKFSKEQGESDLSGLKPWKQPCEMAQWRNSGASKLGGGIQKRIRALQSAPGTTELDFTPVKESSKKPVQAFQKPLGKRLVKCEIVRGSHEVSEDNTRGGYGEASDSTAKGGLCDFSARQNRSAGIAFEVSVGGSHGKQHTRSVPSRMRDKYPNKKEKCPQLEESCRTNTTDSPSKERIAGVELASAPESPTKRKSDFEVTLYLPKAPGVKKVKQDPDESKNVTVSDSSLPSSDEKCMCPPGSPTKGVAFEVNFDGSRPQKQNRARLKSTPFRLKGQAGKRFAGTKTPPPSQEVVGDGTAKVRDSPTMTVTESSPSRVGPGNRSGSRGNTGLTGSLEQFSAKPGLYLSRSDTFELKKGSSVIDSVKESDGHDGVTQNASSDGEGGSVSSSRTLAAKTASNSNETAEAPNANQPAQVCDEPAEKLPSDRKTSLSEKRSKLVRSGTYDKEDVETVLDSMSTEPSVTSESSKEECVDSKMGSEPDTESSEEDESGEASSAGLSDDPCSAGDEDVGVWEDCNGGSGVVTCPNCELTSQNCSCSLDPDHELLEWVETSKQLLQKGECAATGSTGSHAAAQQRRVCDAAEPGTEFAPRRETGTEEPGKTAGSGAECVFTEHGDKAVCSPVPHPRVLVRTSASVVLTGSSVSSEEHRLISDEEQDRGLSTQGNRGTYDLDETVTAEKSEENFVELLDQLATSVEVTLEERSSFASGNQSSSVLQRAAETEEPEHERNGVGMPGDSDTCVDGTFPGGSWIASRNQGPSIDLEQVVGPHGLQGQEEGGGTLDEDQTLGSVEAEKRGTYDFEEVSNILDQSADVETLKRLSQQQDGGTLDEDQTLGSVVTEKRGTYDLEEISNILDQSAEVETLETLSQQQDGETVDESQTLGSVVAEKRGTYDLEEVSNILDQNADVETNKTLSQQQDGETLGESQMLGSVVAEKRGTYDLEVSNILDQSADVETLKTLSQQQDGETLGEDQTLGSVEVEKRGTYDLEEVSNILDQSAEVDVNDLLDELASLEASWEGHTGGGSPTAELPPRSTSDGMTPTSQEDQPGEAVLWALGALASSADSLPFDAENQGLTAPRSRGTYTLDQVAETLEQATTEGGKTFEEAFEDALENTDAFELEDCVPVEPERRVTYTLDGVASVLDNAEQGGATVVEALGGIAEKYRSLANELDCVVEVIQTRASPRSSAAVVAVPSERRGADGVDAGHMNGSAEKRGTYTLDDVSVALENASSEGIPVVEALEHVSLEAVSIAMEKEAVLDQSRQQNALESGLPRGEDTAGTPHRGTYPLEDVSADLEAAKQRGLPLIDALARLTGEQGASDVAETPPNRGTYTLDEVSDSLEAAKERGLPIVELLDRLAGSTGDVTLRPQDAVQRRQENLTNRKTYALATPLETIGENSDVTLFDGTTRRAVSRGSLERMKGESADKSNSVKGLVNTLDFLTSACEVLLSTTATKPAPDPAQSHRDGAGLQKPARNDLARAADRKTYTLEDVALTLEGAKEAGLPVVDALRKLSTAQAGGFKGAVLTNLTRYASKSDSALAAVQASENPDRHTHSMDDMSQVLESATSSGLSVIQALDQLTKDLARFRAAHVGARPGRRSLSSSRVRRGGRSCLSAAYRARGKGFPPLFHKACSLDSVLSPALDTRSSERPETNPGIFGPAEPTARSTGSLDTRSAERLMPNPAFFGQTEPTARSTCSLFSRSSERPETNPGIFGSVDPTARSTGSLSSSSASNVNSEESRRGTYTLDTVSAALDSADRSGLPVVEALGKLSVDTSAYPDRADSEYGPSAGSSEEHRRTLTLKKAEDALDRAMAQGLPVVGALDSLTRSQMSEKAQGRHPDRPGVQKSVVNLGGNSRGETSSSRTRQTSPPKPWKKKPSERNATPKPTRNAGLELEADPFFVEIFANVGRKDFEPAPRVPVTQHSTSEHAHASGEASSYSAAPLIDCSADDTSASEVLQSNNARTIDGSRMGDRLESMSMQNKTCSSSAATVIDCSADDTSASEALQRNNARTIDGSRMGDQLESRSVQDDSITLGPKPRALWRASGSVLDKISTLLDSAGESGVAPADALQRAADLCIDEGSCRGGGEGWVLEIFSHGRESFLAGVVLIKCALN